MTYLQVRYRYSGPLSREQLKRIAELTGQYGIRHIRLDEANSVALIEFDASRLKETEVLNRVRRAGILLTEKVETRPAAT